MNDDLACSWRERLPVLEAQLRAAPQDMAAWHWRAEIRVLRFLLSRYQHRETHIEATAALFSSQQQEIAEMTPLERSLLRMSLLIPNIYTKHARPTQNERTIILSRIAVAGDEARLSDEPGRIAQLLNNFRFRFEVGCERLHQSEKARQQRRRARALKAYERKWRW